MPSSLRVDAVLAPVMARFEALKTQQPHLVLCALLDGLAYEQARGQRLETDAGCTALLDGTEDAALAYAGPWVVDAEQQPKLCSDQLGQDDLTPHVSWLIAGVPFDGLVQLLQLKLDVRLPDGTVGLLRFYDPRVLYGLATTLTTAQRADFFGHIVEWHFMHNGKAMRIGHADA
jgi:Domain of unknown function (DUF4123)